MSAFSRMAGWFKKQSMAGGSIAQFVKGNPVFTPRRYDKLADEAYVRNVIAYRCVVMIASACSSVCWKLYKNDQQEVTTHKVLDLLRKPNPTRGGAYFIEELCTYLYLAGNSYIEKTALFNQEPRELYNLRPDRMRVIPGSQGLPVAYEHEVNGVKTRYDVDLISGISPICHLMKPHPLNDWYGLAPVEPAAYSIDQHNAAAVHNTSLLQNSASPSGALIFKGNIDQAKLDALDEKLREKYSSPKKAGKPMVLGGDFDWKQLGLSPKDLDFNTGKIEVAREICTAFGVPHLLVIPGQSTYNNIAEAKLMFWDDTIIPLLYFLQDNFFSWLLSAYGEKSLYFECDLNDVSALQPRRQQQSDKVLREWQSGLLKRDEARMLLGYDKTGEGKGGGGDYYGGNPTQGAAPAKSLTAPRIKALEDLRFVTDEIDQPEIMFAVTELIASELDAVVKRYGQHAVEEIGARSAFEITQEVTNFIKDSTGDLITHINGTTRRLVREAIDEALQNREGFDDIQGRITEIFKGTVSDYRSRVIGTTESTRATGFAADVAIRQAGIEKKEWLAVMDQVTRDTHAALDGQKVAAGAYFQSPSGDRAMFPGGFATAGENINCRCAVAAVFDEGKDRTDVERRDLWQAREVKRLDAEKQLVVISRKIFIMQGDAVLKRMGHIHHEPGVAE